MWPFIQSLRANPGAVSDLENLCDFSGETMGTTFHVRLVLPPNGAATQDETAHALCDRLEEVNHLMSTYQADSELSQFNQYTEAKPFPLSPLTFEVFQLSQQVSEESGRLFDVTVGPLVNAWGFGPEERAQRGPADAELAELRQRVGSQMLTLDPAARTIQKARPDIYCDLSAIAKGYGVDRAALGLEDKGIMNYMVEVGGEVRTRGLKEGAPWKIAIQKPDADGNAYQEILEMPAGGISLATSGDYRNYYEVDGIRLSHTIDPRTGRPITHNLASASVLAPTCAEADAYATTIMVMGPDEGFAFAERLGLSVLLIVREGPNHFSEKVTASFKGYISGK